MITPETHDHALNCETTLGRGCDCGLTGMAGVAFYSSGVAVYKEPVERGSIRISPEVQAGLVAGMDIAEIGEQMYQKSRRVPIVIDVTQAMKSLQAIGDAIVKAELDRVRPKRAK